MHDSAVEKRRLAAARATTWQYRALAVTRGNQSRLGAILIAVLGNDPILDHCVRDLYGPKGFEAPRFVNGNPPASMRAAGLNWGATITSDGYVMATFMSRDGQWHLKAFVCSVDDLINNFRGLADHLKLNDDERRALFTCVREWVKRDWRVNTNLFGEQTDAKNIVRH